MDILDIAEKIADKSFQIGDLIQLLLVFLGGIFAEKKRKVPPPSA